MTKKTQPKIDSFLILALDQATHTGYCIGDKKSGRVIECGTFTAKGKEIGDRYHSFCEQLRDIIKHFPIREIYFEEILNDVKGGSEYDKGFITQKTLAGYYALVQMIAAEKILPAQSIIASHWKKNLGVKGIGRDNQKKQTKDIVNSLYKIDKDNEQDCYDAIGIFYSAYKDFSYSDTNFFEE